MRKYFLPPEDDARALWLFNFANKLPNYAAKYALSGNDVQDMKDSAQCFGYWLDYRNQYEEYLKKLTQYKNELRNGTTIVSAQSIAPTPPTLVNIPVAVAPGIFKRVQELARLIKGKTSVYTVADGQDLGIIGEEENLDLLNIRPEIALRWVQGGHPEIVWKKKGMDGLQIFVDRTGEGAFESLVLDTRPNYVDRAPLPSLGETAVWSYKAIYVLNDEWIGDYCDPVSITVTGKI